MKEQIEKINSTFKSATFCGSLALKLKGLISREPHDIDVILTDKKEYDDVYNKFYRSNSKSLADNHSVLSKTVNVMGKNVDFFFIPDAGCELVEYGFGKVKVSPLEEIILAKLDFIERLTKVSSVFKHIVDLIKLECPPDLLLEAIDKSPGAKEVIKGTFDSGYDVGSYGGCKSYDLQTIDDWDDLPF